MFTGLIQAIGTVNSLSTHRLQVTYASGDLPEAFADLELGDSVAVDGVCLTVTDIMPHGFAVDVSPETLDRTTLGAAAEMGNSVNLEASLRLGGKLGGHLVTGHIDGIGYLESAIASATSWQINFQIPDSPTCSYIIPKGSIAVNGISLTISSCNEPGTWLSIAVIPHTYDHTNLHTLKPGQAVNLEADILGKYVTKLIVSNPSHFKTHGESSNPNNAQEIIDPSFLAEHGYF